MPEHLRALIVVLALAGSVFWLARPQACALAVPAADFIHRRRLWFAITLAAFLAHNFWLFAGIAAALLLLAVPRESNRLALFFFLVFAVPAMGVPIPGFGLANQIFALSYPRLLALTVLLPAFFALRAQALQEAAPLSAADKFLAAYLLLALALQLPVDTFTNTLRYAFYAFVDVVLPYYVASRGLRRLEQFRDALASFALAALVLAAVAVFEALKKWLLYASLDQALGVDWLYGGYLARAGSLRAMASAGHPIALGFVLGVALGFFLFLARSLPGRGSWYLGVGALAAGMLAAFSRGPWLGAAVGLVVFTATSRQALQNLLQLAALALAALPLLLLSPLGESLLANLSFLGTVEAQNIAYRQRLFEASLEIIARNPWFGSFDFLKYLEGLRQGQGIIDVVNTYLGIALANGLVGLGLFVSFFAAVALRLYRSLRALPPEEEELRLLHRSLLATLAGILATIFTVSSITVIPVVYWAVAGLALACSRLPQRRALSGAPQPAPFVLPPLAARG